MKRLLQIFTTITCFLFVAKIYASNIDNSEFKNFPFAIEFIENKGQLHDQHNNTRSDILFYCNDKELSYYFKSTGVSYQLNKIEKWEEKKNIRTDIVERVPSLTTLYRVDLNWVNANKLCKITPDNQLVAKQNFYNPKFPDGLLNVKSFEGFSIDNIYDNISVKYYSLDGHIKYDYIVQPYADYKQIAMEVKGANLKIDKDGRLIITTPIGVIIEDSPKVYQDDKMLEAKWVVKDNIISFLINNIDKSKKLIIDPFIRQWGTYYGSATTHGEAVSVDDFGNVYFSGNTVPSTLIATTGAHQVSHGGGLNDVFLSKFTTNGQRLWSTYYGGAGQDENACVTSDRFGNVFLSGTTNSNSGIATTGSHKDTYNNSGTEAFLVKFDSLGIRQWGTYYGGTSDDEGIMIKTDFTGNIYLAGHTQSSNGISTPGSFQTNWGGWRDAFLVKFDQNGNRIWGTYCGGSSGNDYGRSICIDPSGFIYLLGNAFSGFLGTPGTHSPFYIGGGDIFIVKFDTNGNRQWGTYYGGVGDDRAYGSSVDNTGNLYIVGRTVSYSGISTTGCFQPNYYNSGDALLAKFTPSGQLIWGTYYGGFWADWGYSVDVDSSNNVYIVGYTQSSDTISNSIGHQPNLGGGKDGFFVKFDSIGNRIFGSYYGGGNDDVANSVIVDNNDNVFIAGSSGSVHNISTFDGHQTTRVGSGYNGFLVKFGECSITNGSYSVTSCDSFVSPSGNFVWTSSGVYNDIINNVNWCDSLITINLTINQSYLFNQNISICDGDSVLIYGNYEYTSNIYYDSLQTVYGCDSVLSTTLIIDSAYLINNIEIICPDDSLFLGGTYQNSSGIYYDSLQTVKGCDSIIVTNLSIYQPTTVFIDPFNPDTVCESSGVVQLPFTSPSGGVYSGPGLVLGGFNPSLVGEGTYNIIYTYTDSNLCNYSDTAIISVVICSGIKNNFLDKNFNIYPNPSNGEIIIENKFVKNEDIVLKIFDTSSKLISERVIPANTNLIEIDISEYNDGIYYIHFIMSDYFTLKKIVKQTVNH